MSDYSRRRVVAPLLLLLCVSGVPAAVHAQFDELSEASADDEQSDALLDLFDDRDIFEELNLNNAQRDGIQKILEEHKQQVDGLQQRYDDQLKGITSIGERLRKRAAFRSEVRQKTEELQQTARESLLALLNEAQQATLQKKVGEAAVAVDDDRQAASAGASSPAPAAVRSADTVSSFGPADSAAASDDTATETPDSGAKLSFNFHTAPWTDVLRLFADSAGLTLNLKDTPPGTFTYFDKQQYTPTQALDIMNRFLLQDGYLLVRHDRFLTVLNVSDGIPPNLVETVTPEELTKRGSTEFVRVALPLGEREASKAAEEIRALLGPQGKVAPLESAGSVVVSDIAANLLRVKQLLEPPPKVQPAETIFRAFPLTRIDAPTAADIIRSLFGLQSGVQNVSAGAEDSSRRSSRSRSSREDFFSRFRRGGGDDDDDDRRSRGSGSDSSPAATSQAKVAIDARTNSLLVTATAAEMKIVEEIVEAIDVNPNDTNEFAGSLRDISEPYLEVYELKSSDAQEVAKTLGVLHPGMVVNEDGRNDRIHIWANAEQQQEIAAHIRQLDGATSGEVLAILPLAGLNPYDVTMTLTGLYAADAAAGPTVQLDPSGRGIIVRGSIVQISQIRSLVDQMAAQGPSTTQRTVRVVPTGGQSAFVQEAIGALYPQVTISTSTLPTATSGSTNDRDRGRSSRRGGSGDDDDRSDRYRRFMEFRERFWGGGDRDGGRDRGRGSDRDRGRSRDND